MSPKLVKILAYQDAHIRNVIAELMEGRKQTHWCWYFLPNVPGLGTSLESQEFAVTPTEFVEFMQNPQYRGMVELIVLLVDRAVTMQPKKDLLNVLGDNPVDVLKWNSFLTLLRITHYHGKIRLPADVKAVALWCKTCEHTKQAVLREFKT